MNMDINKIIAIVVMIAIVGVVLWDMNKNKNKDNND